MLLLLPTALVCCTPKSSMFLARVEGSSTNVNARSRQASQVPSMLGRGWTAQVGWEDCEWQVLAAWHAGTGSGSGTGGQQALWHCRTSQAPGTRHWHGRPPTTSYRLAGSQGHKGASNTRLETHTGLIDSPA